MFGIRRQGAESTSDEALHEELSALLDRKTSVESLATLVKAMDPPEKAAVVLSEVAIGLDSSVFLKLGDPRYSADISDYLESEHKGPLILPGQAIQEFWNNHLGAVLTLSQTLKKNSKASRLKQTKLMIGSVSLRKT